MKEFFKTGHGEPVVLMTMTSDMLEQLVDRVAEKLATKLDAGKPSTGETEDWITEKEAQRILGKKATSLWSHRRNGELVYAKVGKKTYYSKESVIALMKANKVERARYAA